MILAESQTSSYDILHNLWRQLNLAGSRKENLYQSNMLGECCTIFTPTAICRLQNNAIVVDRDNDRWWWFTMTEEVNVICRWTFQHLLNTISGLSWTTPYHFLLPSSDAISCRSWYYTYPFRLWTYLCRNILCTSFSAARFASEKKGAGTTTKAWIGVSQNKGAVTTGPIGTRNDRR